MARHGLSAVVCAGVVFGALCPLAAAPRGEEAKDRLLPQLEVQKALEAGLAHLQAGQFKDAVQVLEKKVHLIDGNREYLRALRDAYIGHLTQLKGADRAKEARDLRARLAILDPTFHRELPASAPVAAPPSAPAPTKIAVRPTPGPAPATPSGDLVSRAKIDDLDPFADSNSVKAHKARALVAQAERAFAEKKYDTANRLFAQAHQAQPAETKAASERWAYCKLHMVTLAINRAGSDMAGAPELEREVRDAVAMAPKLEATGANLLREMRERAPKVEVKHTPRKGTGWAVAETTNFRIFHAQTTEQAERAAKAAETARATLARKCVGYWVV
jgi:tetratricopeptide (TPR) repeat protein